MAVARGRGDAGRLVEQEVGAGVDAPPMTRPSTAMIDALRVDLRRRASATLPSTVTRPSAMSASLARREATPAAAGPSGAARRASVRARLGGCGGSPGRRDHDRRRHRGRTRPGPRPRPPRRAGRRRRRRAAAGSSRLVSPNRSRKSKPVPYRNGRPGRVRPAELHDEPPVEQRADRVVRIDAADALDARPS